MSLDIFELRVQNKKINFRQNCFNIVFSDSLKIAEKCPLKLPKKCAKKYQRHEIVHNLWRIPRPKRFIL